MSELLNFCNFCTPFNLRKLSRLVIFGKITNYPNMLFPRCLFFPLLPVQTFALFYKKEGAIPLFTLEAVAGRFLTQQSCDCLCSLRSTSLFQTSKLRLSERKRKLVFSMPSVSNIDRRSNLKPQTSNHKSTTPLQRKRFRPSRARTLRAM